MRKLERQPHASLSAWALIQHTLGKTAFRAAAKPGTSPSGSVSFSLLPFGSPQPTTPASSTSAKWLVASKPFGRLCVAQKYGKLPGHHLGVGEGCRAQAGGTSAGVTPNQGHFAGLHLGDSSHARALLLQRCLLLLPLPPHPPFPGSSPGPSRARLQHPRGSGRAAGHRSPMAGAMLPSAGTGAALQRGESRTRWGAGGEGTPGGAQHIKPGKFSIPDFHQRNQQTKPMGVSPKGYRGPR